MQGIIASVKHFEIHDGPGVRTTLFLKGCPLRCQWCHNPESLSAAPQLMYTARLCLHCGACAQVCALHRMDGAAHQFDREGCAACGRCVSVCPAGALSLSGRRVTAEEILPELLEDRLFFGPKGGVTLSGGEPLQQSAFACEVLRLLHQEGVHTAVDTTLFASWEVVNAVREHADLFLVDVKAISEDVHIRCTGVSNQRILDNLRRLDAQGMPMEIRVPFIPGMNGGEMEAIAAFLASLRHSYPVRVLPYHDYGVSKYQALGLAYPARNVPTPTVEETARISALFGN